MRSLDPWIAGAEVGLFALISGGAGVALLWFVAQGEASPYIYPNSAIPAPALSNPAPAASVARPCGDRSGGVAQVAITCIPVN
ncbi:hypothetical protein C8255_19710 [filamentous cyanobacterium CCP3]|nr:hypothetical protein C8255_19710 [filamentous cyanobacterium CCP3]